MLCRCHRGGVLLEEHVMRVRRTLATLVTVALGATLLTSSPAAGSDPIVWVDAFRQARLSPNGDGVGDTASISVTVSDVIEESRLTWNLAPVGGEDLLSEPVEVPFEGLFVAWDLDPAAAGLDLTEGVYTLTVEWTGVKDGLNVAVQDAMPLTVDFTAPQLAVTAMAEVFYPTKDDWPRQYANTVKFGVAYTPTAIDNNHYSYEWRVVNADGRVVARATDNSRWDSKVVWDGRSRGSRAPEGSYRLELTASDSVGNTAEYVADAPVRLSHAAYRRVAWHKTVTARGSMFADWSGDCGRIRKPGVKGGKGSLGYYSNGRCQTDDVSKGVAVAAHRVVLPRSEAYSTVRIRAHGGPVERRHLAGLRGISNEDTALGRLTALSGPWGMVGWIRHRASRMMWRDRAIYWYVNTGYGQRFDITSFDLTLKRTIWTGPRGTAPYSRTAAGRPAMRAPEHPDRRTSARRVNGAAS